jgi:hypothetical protein
VELKAMKEVMKQLRRSCECAAKAIGLALFGTLLLSLTLLADNLGFFEQKFTAVTFEKGKWSRDVKLPCYAYTATEDGAIVEVLRLGTGSLVPFKATKGLKVTICGSTAAFDEGFEAGKPTLAKAAP